MSFRRLRFAEITGTDESGYPEVGEWFALLTVGAEAAEINNISCQLEDTLSTKTLQADDQTEVVTKTTAYTLTVTAYGVDAEALSKLMGVELDGNGNFIDKPDAVRPHFVVFYQGANEKGKAFQKYFYDVVCQPINDTDTTDGDTAESLTITLNGQLVTLKDGTRVKSATIYEGNTGWATGEPTTVYTEAAKA